MVARLNVMRVGSVNNPQTIYVGTGEANYSADSRYGAGILISNDGGASWDTIAGPIGATSHVPAFFRHAISKITIFPAVLFKQGLGGVPNFARAFGIAETGP